MPPNCTPVIQPFDQGIIHALKNKYGKVIFIFMLLCAEEERESSDLSFLRNPFEEIYFLTYIRYIGNMDRF